ncbi:MAG: NAD(P)-dependent oxidoreductase, partial [Vulcanimicrobiaceae bacterium]
MKCVIAESFAVEGQDVLRERGIEIVSCVGMPREMLLNALETADALIVRSETRVDRALLQTGSSLRVVARAGVGVDAIDVAAATEAGIVVVNTPAANTIAATELTMAMMLSALRHIPAANASLREGRWERGPFVGRELYGKTLGII